MSSSTISPPHTFQSARKAKTTMHRSPNDMSTYYLNRQNSTSLVLGLSHLCQMSTSSLVYSPSTCCRWQRPGHRCPKSSWIYTCSAQSQSAPHLVKRTSIFSRAPVRCNMAYLNAALRMRFNYEPSLPSSTSHILTLPSLLPVMTVCPSSASATELYHDKAVHVSINTHPCLP